jgi:glyoxylase-like metal-dependent hydrolase (beta-lactamase superfamily II)
MSSPWREVGDRVWIRRYASLDQTIGVVGGEAGLAVIDTRSSNGLADELRADLERLPGSLAAVVNTHGHWDHVFGNARFVPAPIWGHVRCAAMITERGDEMRVRAQRAYPSEAIGEVELTPPTELFADSVTLDLGDRQVELRYLGRGHTDNDIVVVVPDASVLFAGDLLEDAPAPGFGDSYPIAWVAAGRALLDLVEGVVVPGHGNPFDRAFAERQVADLAVLAELAKEVASGVIGSDEALTRSPFPAQDTGVALERARRELSAGSASVR